MKLALPAAEQPGMSLVELVTRLVVSLRRSDGQTLMEYGMMVAVIALVAIGAALLFGGNVSSLAGSNAAGV